MPHLAWIDDDVYCNHTKRISLLNVNIKTVMFGYYGTEETKRNYRQGN